jgi:hypothetical protein
VRDRFYKFYTALYSLLYNVIHAHSGLRDTTQGIEVTNEVFRQSFDTKYAMLLLYMCGIK